MATKSVILTRINTELRDSNDKAFSAAEKLEALTRAIDDEYVYTIIEDTDTTFKTGTRSYEQDSSYKAVLNVAIDSAGDGFPTDLPGDAWTYIDGNLIFDRRYMNLANNTKLYLTVARKLTINDDIPSYLVSYVLNLAISFCAEFLANIKVNRFLKNDTTMAELIGRINLGEQKASRLRNQLRNQNSVRI